MIDLSPTTSEAVSLTELFAAHYQPMVRLAGLLGADDPEDIAQEAFARLHARRGRLREHGAAVSYVRSTVCNLTRNRLRHLKLVRQRPLDHSGVVFGGEHAVITAEKHGELLAALNRLPRRQREALVLRYWLDLSEQEIADTMGVSAGSVKTHASRGLAALGRSLKEEL
ncbi:SigE family RNA polymerase sigma factor [Streptosporangium subroseum]|uniref:SigE family RNA polymerase sigma factor n=1 Tax=Streptosporangium subroseum TaxID=106412 RepID=UPI000B782D32|nr:SigE family RNA polymerase sigma factor [Streptosporangium subroseum]